VEYGSSRRHRRRGFKYIIKIGGGNQRAGEEEKAKYITKERRGSWEETGEFISPSHPRHMNLPRPFTSQSHFPSLNGTVSIRSRVAVKTCQTAEDPTCF